MLCAEKNFYFNTLHRKLKALIFQCRPGAISYSTAKRARKDRIKREPPHRLRSSTSGSAIYIGDELLGKAAAGSGGRLNASAQSFWSLTRDASTG
jgi:hypothetical protein